MSKRQTPLSPRYTSDASVTAINVFRHGIDEFTEDETIEGCAILATGDVHERADTNGFYLMKAPSTHEEIRSVVSRECGVALIPDSDRFHAPYCISGFYTNKGNFLTRKKALWLIIKNNLPTVVPVDKINPAFGPLSSDIWNKDGTRYPNDTDNTGASDAVVDNQQPKAARGNGIGHLQSTSTARPKDSQGKVIPKTVSEMMREKRMKKNIRKFTGGKQHHFPSDN